MVTASKAVEVQVDSIPRSPLIRQASRFVLKFIKLVKHGEAMRTTPDDFLVLHMFENGWQAPENSKRSFRILLKLPFSISRVFFWRVFQRRGGYYVFPQSNRHPAHRMHKTKP